MITKCPHVNRKCAQSLSAFTIAFIVLIAGGLLCPASLHAQQVGDTVRMQSDNVSGVPVHPADGDRRYVRWPNGSTGEVVERGRWFRVRTPGGDEGWIVGRYLTVISEVDARNRGTSNSRGDSPAPANGQLAYAVGTWNIEHFHDGTTRGFPENGRGGPSYPQDERDLQFMAGLIRDQLQVAILVLNEINGVNNRTESVEMDNLVSALGAGWRYEISSSGRSQRVAILYNEAKARKGACHEFSIPRKIVQEKDIAERDPLGCFFTFLGPDGAPKNDLVVIGVHLASGQNKNLNHNAAMKALIDRFGAAFDGDPFPSGEKDIVIAGDFNANRYDSDEENFWSGLGGSSLDIDVLAPADGEQYPGTRLAGVPLAATSKIDYVMASMAPGGVRQDLVQLTAHIHQEILITPLEEFRRKASDHIPVTIRIKVTDDDDN